MELMLWLMMRSEVLSGDLLAESDDDEGCAVAVIFGFGLVHFAASQG